VSSLPPEIRLLISYLKEEGIEIYQRAGSSPPPPLPLLENHPSSQGKVQEPSPILSLKTLREKIGDCTRCFLSQGRTHLVFGEGNPTASLMFVGEGPGEEEDLQGRPFVGAAGRLLTRMIEAMGFKREEVYIANVVKCRPPNNREPKPEEIRQCLPFLKEQISIIRPRILVTLGKCAVQSLLSTTEPISRLRGRWQNYEGLPLMPTYHPAYLLRNPSAKREVWSDLQKVMEALGKK
jgi:DNA polymerase